MRFTATEIKLIVDRLLIYCLEISTFFPGFMCIKNKNNSDIMPELFSKLTWHCSRERPCNSRDGTCNIRVAQSWPACGACAEGATRRRTATVRMFGARQSSCWEPNSSDNSYIDRLQYLLDLHDFFYFLSSYTDSMLGYLHDFSVIYND